MEASSSPGPAQNEDDLRKQAHERIKRRREFWAHAAVYVIVNAALVVIWAVTKENHDNFWPIWIMGFWGIGLAGDAWRTFGQKPITEADIDREVEKLR